jgi:hypothetical protein
MVLWYVLAACITGNVFSATPLAPVQLLLAVWVYY